MNIIWNDRFWPFRTKTITTLTPTAFADGRNGYELPSDFGTFEALVGSGVYRTDRRNPAITMVGLDVFLHDESLSPTQVGQPLVWALQYYLGVPRILVHPKPLVGPGDDFSAWPTMTVHYQVRSPRLLYKGDGLTVSVDDHIAIDDELYLLPVEWRYLVELGGNWRRAVAVSSPSAGDELALFKLGLDQMRSRLVTPIRGIAAAMPGRMRPLR